MDCFSLQGDGPVEDGCVDRVVGLEGVRAENVTPERTQLLKMYGAEIVYSEGSS